MTELAFPRGQSLAFLANTLQVFATEGEHPFMRFAFGHNDVEVHRFTILLHYIGVIYSDFHNFTFPIPRLLGFAAMARRPLSFIFFFSSLKTFRLDPIH